MVELRYVIYNYEYVKVGSIDVPIVVKCKDEQGNYLSFTQIQKGEREAAGDKFIVGDLHMVYIGTFTVNNQMDYDSLPHHIQETLTYISHNLGSIFQGDSRPLQRRKQRLQETLGLYARGS